MTGSQEVPAAMLYIPGADQEKLSKIASLGVDAVILDLEDAVEPGSKDAARQLCRQVILDGAPGCQIWVRINSTSTEQWARDLDAVVVPGLTGLVVPKTESAADLARVDGALKMLEEIRQLPAGSISVLALLETVAGLTSAAEIARSGGRLRCLGLGAGDLAVELRLPKAVGADSSVMDWARTQVVIASRLGGLIPPHDSVFANYRDKAGLAESAQGARAMGFSGKHAIHPDQMPTIRDVFGIQEAEIDHAKAVVAAYEATVKNGGGAVGLDGELVDAPIAYHAYRSLESAGD